MNPSRDIVSLLVLAALMGCNPDGTDSSRGTTDGDPADTTCVDDRDFFRDTLWPEVLEPSCFGCHASDGVANTSDFVLAPAARPDSLDVNQQLLADIAGLERQGKSLILLKPLGEEDHGGGAVLTADSVEIDLLSQFVDRLASPIECADDDNVGDPQALGLELLAPPATVRKAALLLVGRLPTDRELASVRAGGESALIEVLWQMMATDAFADRMVEWLNDELHTDRYLLGRDGIGIFDDHRFPEVYWYESAYDDDYSTFRQETSWAIAREPLALVGHIVREDLPWGELLTADYTMVNDYLAQAYGLEGATWPAADDPDSLRWRPATIPGIPHAGLLTTSAFLNRYPTTPTNRNRHRSWAFFKKFLATDILTFADRPIDPTISSTHNPTLNDPQCTVCHGTLDPVAGAFQNWDDEGTLDPRDEGWYAEMTSPGFGEAQLPAVERSKALAWVAERAVDDPRFALSAVRTMLHAITGLELLSSGEVGDDPVLQEALDIQDGWIDEVASEFTERGQSIKWVVERVVRSHWFRAIGDNGASPGVQHHAGMAHLLTPAELDRKIIATTGLVWRENMNSEPLLLDRYRLLYGGIDSFSVLERLTEPNGIMANIALRMGSDVACEAVPRDLVLPPEQRRLLPHVELTWAPETDEGFEVPEAIARIRANLKHLHSRLLGEELTDDSEELDASYELFYDLWKQGKAGIEAETIDDALPSDCRAEGGWYTNENLPDSQRIRYDPDHLVRAWIGVVAYLLSDSRFLYE